MKTLALLRRGSLSAALGCALACVFACQKAPPPPAQEQETQRAPQWLQHTEVRVERMQASFENNTEVFVTLVNRSAEPLVIDRLDAAGAAVLEHEGGALARIHPISVGVKKPIRVEPGKVKAASLLFQAAPGRARALRLFDREIDVGP